jgi:glycosyltransferase involved in cell wall biosynthesis
MRLLYVVQRYGETIAGGAEQACREFAERMAARGHHVEIATTCAQSYVDWANAYEPGTSELNGVLVHRFPVARARDNESFIDLHLRMTEGRGVRARMIQREWHRVQGPYAPALPDWIERNAGRFDRVIVFTYLYWTTAAALRAAAGLAPTVLTPTVHDEPPLRLSVFDEMFHLPDAHAMLTPEERDLIKRRFHFEPPGAVTGIGVDLPDLTQRPSAINPVPPGGPYLLYAGRIDPFKGARELIDFFVTYKRRHPGSDLRLVMLGEPLMEMPERDDLVVTGFVDYDVRDVVLSDAYALAQPSYFESFSMVLTEALAHARPALVQGRCEVLRGHSQRSGAAIPYSGFAEFEVAVELLTADPDLADRMGAAGRAYVEREYDWEIVLERYERLLDAVAGST